MDPLVGTLVLIALALAGARVSFSTERVGPGPRLLFRTGTHFLALGFLLGPAGLGLLTRDATQQLFPFLALGLGWVGFHFGLQLDWDSLRRFPGSYHLLALGQAVLTFAGIAGAGWLLLELLGVESQVLHLLLFVTAATASVTTPAGIAMVSSNFMVRGNVRDVLFFTSSLDAVVGIVALSWAYATFRPEALASGAPTVPQYALVGVALGLGLVCGIVFLWLVRSRPAGEELVLYILGMCALASGAALQWGLSPLLVSVAMGVVVANLVPERQRIFSVLQRWEKPVYLTFLLIAGALLIVPTWWMVALAVAYTVARTLAKTASMAALASVVRLQFSVPRRAGLALVPQGGISLAMAVSATVLYPALDYGGRNTEAVLFTVIVMGVMLSELVGPLLLVHVLRQAGEISPQVEEALAKGDQRGAEREAIRTTVPADRVGDGEG